MTKPSLLTLDHVTAGYDRRPVIRDISLEVYPSDFLGIIGPNGGGKTTLIKVILGLLQPLSGSVRFQNPSLSKRIGYMPQVNALDKKFPILVREVVASGLMGERIKKEERGSQTEETLCRMGIEGLRNKPISELSGGQLQRVLLGRALINQPQLLILDEPSTYVDKRFESRFYELLQEINEETAIILVSHDMGTIVSNVKNIACVNETLHYHPGSDIHAGWIEEHLGCPFEVLGHGEVPHRILKKHE